MVTSNLRINKIKKSASVDYVPEVIETSEPSLRTAVEICMFYTGPIL